MHTELSTLISEIQKQGVKDENVLEALRQVDRKFFVPEPLKSQAYENRPLPIGEEQTISQPFIVGYVAQELHLQPDDRVLEIGSGSGYQAAVLSQLCQTVYGIEILPTHASRSQKKLRELGFLNIQIKCADGHRGWREHGPFQKILISAASNEIPRNLIRQLDVDGVLIMPLIHLNEDGTEEQQHLIRITKTKDGLLEEILLPVRFVTMTHAEDYVF